MKIIRSDSEKYLLERIESLRKGQAAWSAVHIRLSRLKAPPQSHSVRATENVIGAIPGTDDATLFVFANYDLLLLLPRLDNDTVGKVIDEVSIAFAEDDLAQTFIDGRGNALCMSYASKDDLVDLHRLVIRMQRGKGETDQERPPNYVPNAERFRCMKEQRLYRMKPGILLAEDQRFSQQLVLEIIGGSYDVITAGNGIDALQLYVQHAPNIVFLDIDIPGMSGLDVLETITGMDEDAFVVMLTASHLQSHVQQAIDHRARGYIVKPFTRQKIDQYLNFYRKIMVEKKEKSA